MVMGMTGHVDSWESHRMEADVEIQQECKRNVEMKTHLTAKLLLLFLQ